MKSIWKFPLMLAEVQSIDMPEGAEILCVQMQQGTPTLWARVDTDTWQAEARQIAIVGTSNWCPGDHEAQYIGTVQMDAYVWHVFEQKEQT